MVLAAFGFTLAAIVFPIPIAAWFSIVIPAEHHTYSVASKIIGRLATSWARGRGYFPWRAWAVLIHHPNGFWFTLGLAVILAGIMAYMGRGKAAATWGGPPAAGKGQHGTAHWRGITDLAKGFSRWQAPSQKQPEPANPSGILVGQAGPGQAWVLDKDEHILLIGSTGSRKTRGVILPTIGVIGWAGKESMILTDPKGELYQYTAPWLRSRGYDVVMINLRSGESSRGNRWNPVGAVTEALGNGRVDQASAWARDIAHVITYSQEYKGGDPIWPQSQEALTTALILAVAQGQPPPGGLKLREPAWTWPTPEQKHMGSVYASLNAGLPGDGGRRLDAWIHQFPPDHPAYEAYGPVRLAVDRTRSSILVGATAQLSLWADTETKWLTADQDHDLAGPGQRPTAVFLVIPDERSTRYPLATLYVQQTLQSLVTLADANNGRLPVTVNVLMDEFGNLPQMRDFDHTVTVARGRGIRLLLAVQDLAQIKKHYGDSAQTIKGNCNTWMYLLTSDLDTAKEISGKMGEYTTQGETNSMPKVYWTSSTTPGHATNTTNLVGRALLKPDELLRWPEFQSLVLQARHAPARLPLPDLSGWASVWPEIQQKTPLPDPVPIDPVPVWRPPLPPKTAERVDGGPPKEEAATGAAPAKEDGFKLSFDKAQAQ